MIDQSRRVAVIFDLDGTITKRDSYLGFLVGFLCRNPQRLINAIPLPFAVLIYWLKIRDNSWLKSTFLHAVAGGTTKVQLDSWLDVFLRKLFDTGMRPGAIQAIKRHRDAGHYLILASASFDFYVERIARNLGFDDVICTRSAWDAEGRLTANLPDGNCYGDAKLKTLVARFGEERDHWYIITYSDHHSDFPIFEWANYGAAVNPTQRLMELAMQRGFPVLDWSTEEGEIEVAY